MCKSSILRPKTIFTTVPQAAFHDYIILNNLLPKEVNLPHTVSMLMAIFVSAGFNPHQHRHKPGVTPSSSIAIGR